MCLYTLNPKPHKAQKDIICYKAYYVFSDYILSPSAFHEYKKELNQYIYGQFDYFVNEVRWFFKKRIKEIGGRFRITNGFIHVYKEDNDESIFLKGENLYLFKCIIPKGTYYYKDDYFPNEMCARKIKILEQIKKL